MGTEPGQGQVVKACLQALVGAQYTAIFELMVMGCKAGVDPQVLQDVISTSVAGSKLFDICVPLIMDRKFKDTGSSLAVMSKDLNITMDLAREVGCAMPTVAIAREMVQAVSSASRMRITGLSPRSSRTSRRPRSSAAKSLKSKREEKKESAPKTGRCAGIEGGNAMKAVKWLNRHAEEVVLVAMLILMLLIEVIQIFMRRVVGSSLSWAEEVVRYLFVWSGFLSISFTIQNQSAMRLTMAVAALPRMLCMCASLRSTLC